MIIDLINEYIGKALRVILTLFMALMVITVTWQVVSRFVLNSPSNFTDELSRYLLVWIGILGGAYTFSIKRHLALEILSSKVGDKGQHVLTILTNMFVVLFSSVAFIYGGSVLVQSTLANGQISPGIVIFGNHFLIGYLYIVVPIAGVLITYYGIIDMVQSVRWLVKGQYKHNA